MRIASDYIGRLRHVNNGSKHSKPMFNCPANGDREHVLGSRVSGKLMTALLAIAVLAVGCLVLMDHSDESDAAVVENGTCGSNITWELDDTGTLTLTGSGRMVDGMGGDELALLQ